MNARALATVFFMSFAAHAADTTGLVQPLAASSNADGGAPVPSTAGIPQDDESLMRLQETPPDAALGILALEALFEASAELDTANRAAEAQSPSTPPAPPTTPQKPAAERAQSGSKSTTPQAR